MKTNSIVWFCLRIAALLPMMACLAAAQSTNIAPNGQGYYWNGMTTSTAITHQTTTSLINNGNLTNTLNCNVTGETTTNRYEAAGVIFSTAQSSITQVVFINGPLDSNGNGNFEANLSLQTYNGSTWSTVSGWSVSPAYPYDSTAVGQTYIFTGPTLNNVRGVRVAGEVRLSTIDNSWSWTVNQVMIYANQTAPNFTLTATPASQTVTAGSGANYTVSVSPKNGFTSSVNLSVSGLPSGATASFNPSSISGGSGSSTLGVSTSSTTTAGTYTLTVTGTSGSLTQSATTTLTVNAATGGTPSTWMGYNWNIDPDGTPIGGGLISSKASNLSVDSNGYLHMKISNNGGTWTGAEMFTQQNLGFGTYQWVLQGNNFYHMDPPIVLGLFNYGPANNIGTDGSNEIDIEFSNWDGAGTQNLDYTVYPAVRNRGKASTDQGYSVATPSSNTTTVRFVWSSTSISFYTMSGTVGVNSAPTNVLQSYTYNGTTSSIPQAAIPAAMNIWTYNALPTNPWEIVVQSFSYQQ